MSIMNVIRARRSVRKYKSETVDDAVINEILEAARWAPSGLNNQPWRFVVIKDKKFKEDLSRLTHYSSIIASADFCIAVFYNHDSGYHRDKDLMSIGAAIENMLLYSHDEGIGSVWLGEILKSKDKVNELLSIDNRNEFVALIAFGYPDENPQGERKKMSELILKVF